MNTITDKCDIDFNQRSLCRDSIRKELKHNSSSNQTLAIFKKMEKSLQEKNDDIGNIKISVARIEEQIKPIASFINESPKKFASKLTEKIVYYLVAIILVAVFGTIINSAIRTNNDEDVKSIIKLMIEENNNKFFEQ